MGYRTVILTEEQKAIVSARVEALTTLAFIHYGQSFKPIEIDYSLRGRTAGQANATRSIIKINTILLVENFEHYVKQTIGHEVAHIIQYTIYGIVINSITKK